MKPDRPQGSCVMGRVSYRSNQGRLPHHPRAQVEVFCLVTEDASGWHKRQILFNLGWWLNAGRLISSASDGVRPVTSNSPEYKNILHSTLLQSTYTLLSNTRKAEPLYLLLERNRTASFSSSPKFQATCFQRKIIAVRLDANQLRELSPSPQLQQECSSSRKTLVQ